MKNSTIILILEISYLIFVIIISLIQEPLHYTTYIFVAIITLINHKIYRSIKNREYIKELKSTKPAYIGSLFTIKNENRSKVHVVSHFKSSISPHTSSTLEVMIDEYELPPKYIQIVDEDQKSYSLIVTERA